MNETPYISRTIVRIEGDRQLTYGDCTCQEVRQSGLGIVYATCLIHRKIGQRYLGGERHADHEFPETDLGFIADGIDSAT